MPGPAVPRGEEMLVNIYTGQWQRNPDIATLNDGTVVAVWDSFFFEGEQDFYYIGARRFGADGNPIGSEVVLSDVGLDARYARVTALKDGGYAVAWEAGEDGPLGRTDIWTLSFDADGTARGEPIRVSPRIDDDFYAPEISALPGGGWVVTWSGTEEDRDGTFQSNGLYGRVFDADGDPVGSRYKINPEGLIGDQANARIVELTNGNSVVIYDSELSGTNVNGGPVDEVQARFLGPGGRPLGPAFAPVPENDGVNGGVNLTRTDISVAALSGGRFVITWFDVKNDFYANGDSSFQIVGRIFGPDGEPQSREFRVNMLDASVPQRSSVAALADGGFVVTWDIPSETDSGFRDVYGQVFSDRGRPVGDNVLITSDPRDAQEWSSATGLLDGGFAVVYESDFLDGDSDAIALRFFGAGGGSGGGPDTVGTPGADRLKGSGTADEIDGLGGSDVVRGLGGADTLSGGRGDDRLEGGRGSDTVRGDNGDDTLLGGSGSDALVGGKGADRLIGNGGRDTLTGGGGKDTLDGGQGNDRLAGGGGKDTLEGSQGNDRLAGGGGADRLLGGQGADLLAGGGGSDRLTGNGGSDTFVFDRGDGRDTITDFSPGVDVLDVPRGGDVRTTAKGIVIDFGGGDVLTLLGVRDPDLLDV